MNDTFEWMTAHADEQFAYLTTTGRHSGKPHRIEIWFGVTAEKVFLMSGGRDRSDWVKNLLANPAMSIEVAGRVLNGTARVLTDGSPDDEIARKVLVEKYQKNNELEAWGKNALVIAIDMDVDRGSSESS